MPSLEDVEMDSSSSASSEIREVEMEDAGSSPEREVESAQPVTALNGHMTLEEEGKSYDDKSGDQQTTKIYSIKSRAIEIVQDQEMSDGSLEQEQQMPSAEPEGDSSDTADEEMASPGNEQQKSDDASSTDQHQTDYNFPPPSQSIKMDKEIARINEVLAEVSPEAAQKVLKEKWRMFLFENYDEAHIAFILRAGLKNANASIMERIMKDDGHFKDSLLKYATKKPGFVEKIIREASADTIADHVSEKNLDYVVAESFKTVSGKTLIKWLATAERLGYKADDILDEEDESVCPNVPIREQSVELLGTAPAPTYRQHAPQHQPPQHFPQQAPYQKPYQQPYQQPYQPPYPPQGQPPYQPPSQSHLANLYKDPLLIEQERQAGLNTQQAQDVQAAIARSAQASSLRRGPPGAGPGPAPNHASAAVTARQDQDIRAQGAPTSPLLCNHCQQAFHPDAFDGYTYHITKKVCEKTPPAAGYKWQCGNCLSGFTTKQGQDYHSLRKVCVGEIAPPTPAIPSLPILPPTRLQMIYPRPQPQAPPPQAHPQPQAHNPQVAVSSQGVFSRPISSTPQAPVAISRPSLGMTPPGPGRPRKVSPIRHSLSELTPEKRASLNQAIQESEDDANQRISSINNNADYSAEERQRRIQSVINANTTRKSYIRKSHGVSLRMREKHKQARFAAGIYPVASVRTQQFRARQSPAGTPNGSPAPSFSPIINSSTISRPAPSATPLNPHGSGPNGNASPSGFGMLKSVTALPLTPGSTSSSSFATLKVNPNNKRKHNSQEPIGSEGLPRLSMQEVSAEDAAARFAKGYEKKFADRARADRERNKGKDKDTSMTDAPNGNGSGSRGTAIEISSDSEDVSENPVVESVEGDAEETAVKERSAVGGNMARRGEDESTGEITG